MAAVTMPVSGSHNPAAILQTLHLEAEHKAALRMYFAAADLCRSYHGPLAEETKSDREQLAISYEKLGAAMQQSRQEHGVATPAPMTWHCPACHVAFPEKLVVCDKCGFDLRTGKVFQATVKFPELPKRYLAGNTKVTSTSHVSHARRREDNSVAWLIGGTLAGIIFVMIVLAISRQHLTVSPTLAPPPRIYR